MAAGIGYAVDVGTLIYLHEVVGWDPTLSAAIAFMVGLMVLYLLSQAFVFKDSKVSSKTLEIGLFALIGIGGLIILTILMWLLTNVASVNYVIAKVLATVVVYGWNFMARKAMYHN